MKLSRILYKQHLDRMFKKHWIYQGKRTPIKTDAEAILAAKGIPVVDAKEVVKEVREFTKVTVIGRNPKQEKLPNPNEKTCFVYKDNNVLLEGVKQAQVLTKTLELPELPHEYINPVKSKKLIDNQVMNIVLSSQVFDAEQIKLPKKSHPDNPMWVYPRTYGLSVPRSSSLTVHRLLQLCETTSGYSVSKEKRIFDNAHVAFSFERESSLIQLEMRCDILVTGCKPLKEITAAKGASDTLPSIYPVNETITIPREATVPRDIYPLQKSIPANHPQLLVALVDLEEMSNIFGEPVNENQVLGRTLVKAFSVAAAYARQKYGADAKDLPDPVSLQFVQTDGKNFIFGLYQLNTLDLKTVQGVKNFWFHMPKMQLFDSCDRTDSLEIKGYNPNVFSTLLSMYRCN